MPANKWYKKLRNAEACLGTVEDCMTPTNYCDPITPLTMPNNCGAECYKAFRVFSWFNSPQVIGRWINGKPLYRQIVGINSTLTGVANTWTDLFSLPGDIDEIVYYTLYENYSYSDGLGSDEYYNFSVFDGIKRLSRSAFQWYVYRSSATGTKNAYVIWYTKTTDSGSMGNPNFPASLNEVLVGSLRGAALYAKVYPLSNLPTAYTEANKNPAILTLASDVHTIIDSKIIITDGTYFYKPEMVQYVEEFDQYSHRIQMLTYYFKDNVLHFSAREIDQTNGNISSQYFNSFNYPHPTGNRGYLFLLYTKTPLKPVDIDTPKLVGYWYSIRPIYRINTTISINMAKGARIEYKIDAPNRLKIISSWISTRVAGYTTNQSVMGTFQYGLAHNKNPDWFQIPSTLPPVITNNSGYDNKIFLTLYPDANDTSLNGKPLTLDATIFYTTNGPTYGCI